MAAVLGLLYDVHGNLLALEAVLADCPADRYLLGGDHVLGPWPGETLERLRGLEPSDWIRGNTDRWLLDRSDAPEPIHEAIDFCVGQLGETLVDELFALPESAAEHDVLYCHASPQSDMESFFPDARAEDAELLMGVEAKRVVFGHTHLAFERRGPANIHLVNPGSVGMPFDGDHRAAYGLAHDDGSVELRRVEYDWRAAAQAARDGVGELPARRIEAASFDPR